MLCNPKGAVLYRESTGKYYTSPKNSAFLRRGHLKLIKSQNIMHKLYFICAYKLSFKL
jgi:hypothetical protein